MRRIGLVLALSLTLVPLAAEAQQTGKVMEGQRDRVRDSAAGDPETRSRGSEAGEGGRVMAPPRRSDRPGLLLWLNTAAKLRLLTERGVAREEMTVRPEDTLRAAGISSRRQARYQRRMSSLLAGREGR